MKCMCAQTRPQFILSSEGVLGGMEFEPMLTPREKSPLPKMSPEEDRTRDAVDSEPKHYQLSYSGPPKTTLTMLCALGVHQCGKVNMFLHHLCSKKSISKLGFFCPEYFWFNHFIQMLTRIRTNTHIHTREREEGEITSNPKFKKRERGRSTLNSKPSYG